MAITSALEIEAKFAVDSSAELPDLTTLPEIGSVAREEHHELSAIYFDTPDLRLTRAKMTLRRRTGGNDSGSTAEAAAITAGPTGSGLMTFGAAGLLAAGCLASGAVLVMRRRRA